MRGPRALAILSAAGADILEVVRVPSSVDPMAIVDPVAWLEPLAGAMGPQAGGVAVSAGAQRGCSAGTPERSSSSQRSPRTSTEGMPKGGWSQARFQRGIEAQVAAHVRRVADLLSRAHDRRPFEHVAIVASSEL